MGTDPRGLLKRESYWPMCKATSLKCLLSRLQPLGQRRGPLARG